MNYTDGPPPPLASSAKKESLKRRWKEVVEEYESCETSGMNYPSIRHENRKEDGLDIAAIHNMSFIEYIREEIKKRPDNYIMQILDVGGGAGIYAEQIRKELADEFRDRIIVHTTGLSKGAANKLRTSIKKNRSKNYLTNSPDDISWEIDEQVHPHDFIARSIFELADSEEFDLIIDTHGEAQYTARYPDNSYEKDAKNIQDYILTVATKLKPGGLASIQINSFSDPAAFREEVEKILQKKFGRLVKIELVTTKNTFSNNYASAVSYNHIFRIKKNK